MDVTHIIVAIIVATPGTIAAIGSYKNGQKLKNVTHAMNSLLDERVKDATTIGHAAGVASERKSNKRRRSK